MMRCRVLSEVSELALEAQTLGSFRSELLQLFSRRFALDAAHALATSDGLHFDVSALDGQPEYLAANAAHYFGELTPAEAQATFTPRTLPHEELYPTCRRERLALYYDYLEPRGIRTFALRVWFNEGCLYQYALERASEQAWAQFVARALPQLDAAFCVVAVAEKLQRARGTTQAETVSRDLTLEYGLTTAEHKSVELLVRGLTNAEIAVVLGLAANTVRNQLAASYLKLGVSRRAEVAYILTSAQHARRSVRLADAPSWFRAVATHMDGDAARSRHPT